MALAHAQLARELGHTAPVEGATRDTQCGQAREPGKHVDERPGLCQLRSATPTGPEPCAFGGRRRIEKAPMLAPRRARWAHRSAVHAGGGDADEEEAVEAGIARVDRAVVHVCVENHTGRPLDCAASTVAIPEMRTGQSDAPCVAASRMK